MRLMTPETVGEKKKAPSQKVLSNVLRSILNETVQVDDHDAGIPVQMTKSQAIGKRLVDIALYSNNQKTSVTAIKIIMEAIEGKPAVTSNTEKKEIPPVQIVIKGEEADAGIPESPAESAAADSATHKTFDKRAYTN